MRMGTTWNWRAIVGLVLFLAAFVPAVAASAAAGPPGCVCGGIEEYAAIVTDLGEVINEPMPSFVLNSAAAGSSQEIIPTGVVAADIYGYSTTAWLATANGRVVNNVDSALHYGDASKLSLNAPVVSIKATSTEAGYWLTSADGGVFSFGDARFYGSRGGQHLAAPIVDMDRMPSSDGYWLLGSDGGVFSFGKAGYYGSAVSMIPQWDRATAIASTLTGKGYWIVTNFGHVYAFGDALKPGVTGNWALKPGNGVIDIRASHNGWFWTLTTRGQVDFYNADGMYDALMLVPDKGKVIALGAVTRQFGADDPILGPPPLPPGCRPDGCG